MGYVFSPIFKVIVFKFLELWKIYILLLFNVKNIFDVHNQCPYLLQNTDSGADPAI